MAHASLLKQIARHIIWTGLVIFSLPASAATVILNFDWLDPSTNHHGTTVTESGYTLSAAAISSTKPSYICQGRSKNRPQGGVKVYHYGYA